MKKTLLIVSFLLTGFVALFAQGDEEGGGNDKIRDKMSEYIQRKLKLSSEEAKQFTPVFMEYFKEWRQTIQDNKGDKLVRQQKIIDLRLRFRTKFREILGEKRGNQVFNQQDMFIQELQTLRRSRQETGPARPRPRVR